MVSCITKGRFGNSCYIMAAAYVYAIKNGHEFHAPKESLAPRVWPVYLQHMNNPLWNSASESVYVNDGDHSFHALPYDKREWTVKNIILGTTSIESGYFPSYKYTIGYWPQIREAFGFKWQKKYGTVGIHIRRGDYVNLPSLHPLCPDGYFLGCVQRLKSTQRIYGFKFFSDDIEYAKNLYRQNIDTFRGYGVQFSEGRSEVEDFVELMNCQFMITSNSSFSVLCATLNPHPEKVVYCPHEDNYFGPDNKHLSVVDLYPPSFIRVKY